MTSLASLRLLSTPRFGLSSPSETTKPVFRVLSRISKEEGETAVSSPELVVSNNGVGVGGFVEKEKAIPLIGGGNWHGQNPAVVEVETKVVGEVDDDGEGVGGVDSLAALWDDGYGTRSIKDYLEASKDVIKPDGGPPRWFCPVECGRPLKNSPVLLFLPGLDGVGFGLMLHHKALGRAFEVRCLHVPVYDRTPFNELVKFVEKTVKSEHAASPDKPIYLVGDSFGGCLALSVAARNPNIDLVVILANPATSFGRSQLQPLFPILEALPDELHFTVPYLLSFVLGDPLKMASVTINERLPLRIQAEQLSRNLTSLLPLLSGLADIIPKETLLWKLKLLKSAASYTNSRLHAVRAEVILLYSGNDNMLPSANEADLLMKSLKSCKTRRFNGNGHTLLLEDGLSLLTVIKGTNTYRRSRKIDYVLDFLPPSRSEFNTAFNEVLGLLRTGTSSALFSTLDDGTIVRGLAGVPAEGPVLLIGYHMLLGLELFSLAEHFLKEKNIMVRGLAHPMLFTESYGSDFSIVDWSRVFGAVPVTGKNLFKLLSTKSHVLLYPGGSREALHYKGEEYKLFWPDHPEFIRMAARFGATIVPFGAVGEDDLAEMVLDYNDYMKIPFLNDYIRRNNANSNGVRMGVEGEVGNQNLFLPFLAPKVPGRLYYLFGKPTHLKGRQEMLKDRESASRLYSQIKTEVESCMAYLLKRREEDPYRNILDRTFYRTLYSSPDDIPAFEF
ncbi:hypothetical protein MLD38_023695 [Melastoma candidum]|uniref:Uncharacterized protein n=1 Tax=Melastoma candidum TaxID=119954 RepID=A0ACB9NRR8_9MYRT|nr:hypothetical protein MLD38_023695 [Melastoma candidum]